MTATIHNNEQTSLQHEQQQEHQLSKAKTTVTSSPLQKHASGTPKVEHSPPAVTQNEKDKAGATTTQGPSIEIAPPLPTTVPVKVPPGYVVPYKRYRDWKEKKTYDVVRPIAAGGYGSVLGVNLDRKLYALKVCDADDTNKKDSFDRETKALRRTDNCHIIKLHAAFQERGHLCLVLELANKSLENVLRQTKKLTLDDAKHYARGIAAGLDYLHQISIVHRDIKPDNILLFGVDSREVKLADFGLALSLGGKRRTIRGACGTGDYQAPEMSGSTPYNTQADVYSFGVTVYRMITGGLHKGRLARVQGTTAKAFFEQVLHKNPNVRFDIQQAKTHAFLQVDQDGEEQSTDDSIGSSLSKRLPETILEEREQKRARQYTPHPRAEDRDKDARTARTVGLATTLPNITTAKPTTSKEETPAHSH
ncbi:MAG: kinase-like domain-containing protein [Linnemannia elongata]|nr:MAG: kinase-like domain-containing protein [Linnemannia elongata]